MDEKKKRYYWGIDIGGTKCAVSLGASDGDELVILKKTKLLNENKTPGEILDSLYRNAVQITSGQGLQLSDIAAAGISCGGPLDSRNGTILSPPNLPGWDEIRVTEFFESKTHIPARLQNDANACALAEWKFGAGKNTQNMVFLTFGTGLGAGIILNGRLYTGRNDMAGEIGHVRLTEDGPVGYRKKGSCEGYCSGGGIAQLGQRYIRRELDAGRTPALLEKCGGRIENVNAKVIADLADAGDPLSREIYRKSGEMFGYTLAVLMDILNPELIVVGSIFARSRNLLEDAMMDVIRREALEETICPIVPAALGELIGDYAALAVAAGS